ncbi:sigma-E factor negative regulatory protein [Hydrogenophaga sp. NFH-34]|uniref:sigma-E factor negative regulatory protein n=1 Tax=Hydrogenophaga sp. NFH-34 TaxID=2744446 RepID=UPI001F15BCC2|nr:sigma-E factor negative regulatory protein [Hydrogenophaga sp. NFH-34]
MNASSFDAKPAATAGGLVPAQAGDDVLSALMDGEATPQEWDVWLQGGSGSAQACADWDRYHLIGEALRGQACLPASRAFFADIEARLTVDEVVRPALLTTPVPQVRGGAANEAVFRWKMLAGVASVAAVVAVGWSVLGAMPGAAGSASGPQLAAAGGSTPVLQAVSNAGPETASPMVVVQTGQGAIIRDPRLEELLAEHRQYGGLSALQMPAGFLRNATHDGSPRR